MGSEIHVARTTPKAFVSYSWDDEPHKHWVEALAARLRGDGVEVTLDRWDLQPGDRLLAFMDRAVRENHYVLIVCTPVYADRSNRHIGGVGYEGDIMTTEVMTMRNERKFIPILRSGEWATSAPAWLTDRYGIDLRGEPFSEAQYQDLLVTLHGTRPVAPPVRPRHAAKPPATFQFQPIRILGVVVDEVSIPAADGTRGSALYRIPFQLSQRPSSDWATVFVRTWNRPPSFDTSHRPGIASVSNDKVILDGTTIQEVEKTHRNTLMVVLEETNRLIGEHERQRFEREQEQLRQKQEHERQVREGADRIKFDG